MKIYIEDTLKSKPIIAVLDCETTGLNPSRNKLLQISAIKLEADKDGIYHETDRLNEYIRPFGKIPAQIEKLTGITNEFIKTKPFESVVFPVIELFFEDVEVYMGYNVSFDLRFIEQLFVRNGEIFQSHPIIDVYELSKKYIKKESIPNKKLETVYHYLQLDASDISFHSALDDVTATIRVFSRFYNAMFSDRIFGSYKTIPKEQAQKRLQQNAEKENEIPMELRTTSLEDADFIIDSICFWSYNFSSSAKLKRLYMRLHAKDNSFCGTVYLDLDKFKFFNKDSDILTRISPALLYRDANYTVNKLGYSSLKCFKSSWYRKDLRI